MNKLRKAGRFIWRHKERMVFGILVVVLVFQVVQVVRAAEETPRPPVTAASAPPPELPQIPTLPVTPAKDYSSLHKRNPFWYWSSAPQQGQSDDQEEVGNIRLESIQGNPQQGYRARIRTQASKWYREGETFESYKLLKIDAEKGQAEVYSEKQGKSIVLTKQ